MGVGALDFSALEKLKLRWISSVRAVERSGTYSVAPIDEPSSEPQAAFVTTAAGEYWIERRSQTPRLIVPLVKPDNFISPVYLRSVYVGRADERYIAPKLFSIGRDGVFKWLDKQRPSTPKVRALDQTVLSWSRSADAGSGVATYRVMLDGKLLTTTTQGSADLPALRDGGHRVTVVAVDRAGNRSRPGVANLTV
jgi:hypothetical protein